MLRFALFLSVFSMATWAQTPMLSISGANFRPMALALTAPGASDLSLQPSVEALDAAFRFDLEVSGLFQMLDRRSFLVHAEEGFTAGSIQFENWSNVGAEILVKTELLKTGNNLQATLHLFTVATGREDFKTQVTAPIAQPRSLAHRLSQAVYRYFTRETGPFESRLTYVVKQRGQKDVVVADWDGQNPLTLTSGGINLLPTLSPGGTTVAFTSYQGGKPEIYAQRIGGAIAPIVREGRMATGVTYSPDGQRIAFSVAQGDGTQIWVAKANGANARVLTQTPYFINTSPSWSPDGTQLAFVSNRAGTPQIYVMSAEGSNVKRLTFQGNYNQTPCWSPRGDIIAFTARDERNAFDLFTVEVATGKIARLTQDQGNNEEPSFSPNGRHLVFMSNRLGSPHLFVMTSEGKNQIPLPLQTGAYSTPEWSR